MSVIGSHKMFSQAAGGGTTGPSLRPVTPSEALKIYYAKKFPDVSVTSLFSIDAFKKGRADHNVPWYCRELVQNWVDANPRGHNLDGIEIRQETLANGKQRFTIQGDWALNDFTALADLDTGKKADGNNAGGIGFGLKESFRDMLEAGIIDPPSVIGEGWSVRYVIANPEEINPLLQKDGIQGLTKPFMASEQRFLKSGEFQPGKCSYVIETDNAELIAALSKFKNYAPHAEQPALQNPDYRRVFDHRGKSEAFTIKWLKSLNQRGSLFIQGQPWSYLSDTTVERGFFNGAHGVSLELGVVNPFEHSHDRGPLNQGTFESTLDLLIHRMSVVDLKKQLQASFHLWANNPGKFEFYKEPGAIVLLKKIVSRLYCYHECKLADLFPDKDLVAVNSSVNQDEIDMLIKQGKIVCPEFFTRLHVPLYQRDTRTEAKNDQPDSLTLYHHRQAAQERGAVIASDIPEIEQDSEGRKYFQFMAELLRGEVIELKKNNHKEWELVFDKQIPHGLLNAPHFGNLRDERLKSPAALLQKLRNLIHLGLVSKVIQSPNLEAQGMMANFGSDYDFGSSVHILTTKVSSICSDPSKISVTEKQRLCFKLNSNHEAIFREVFKVQDGVIWHPSSLQGPVAVEANDQEGSNVTADAPVMTVDPVASDTEVEKTVTVTSPAASDTDVGETVTVTDSVVADENESDELSNQIDDVNEQTEVSTGPGIDPTIITLEPYELAKFPWFIPVGAIAIASLLFFPILNGVINLPTANQKSIDNQTAAKQPVEVEPIGDDEIKPLVIDDKAPEMPIITDLPKVGTPKPEVTITDLPKVGTPKPEVTITDIPKVETPKPESEIDITGVEKAIDELAKKSPVMTKEDANQKEFEKWKAEQKYGQAKKDADYTKGRSVIEFVKEFNAHGIKDEDVNNSARDKEINRLKAKLEGLQEGTQDHEIQDFAIVAEPEARHKEQIEILREFMHKSTGVKDDVDFFIFTGKGTKGVNFGRGKAYGLHKSLFDGQMVGALEVYAHELSHNLGAHGDSEFYNTMQALLAATIDKVLNIAKKPEDKRTEEDKAILRLQEEWNARAGIPNRVSMHKLQMQKYLAIAGAKRA